jgi:hypothetical protein
MFHQAHPVRFVPAAPDVAADRTPIQRPFCKLDKFRQLVAKAKNQPKPSLSQGPWKIDKY